MSSKRKNSHPIWGIFFLLSGVAYFLKNPIIALLLCLLGCFLIAPNWFLNKIQNVFGNGKNDHQPQAPSRHYNSRANLLKLQNLIFQTQHTQLKMSESELYSWANNICQQKLKILNDSANLVNTTKNPQVFFERYDLLYKTAEELIPYEDYVNFSGSTPTQLIEQFDTQRDAAIMKLIDRAYETATQKASEMKTEKGRHNQFVKMFESFSLYEDELSDEAKQYLSFLKESINMQFDTIQIQT